MGVAMRGFHLHHAFAHFQNGDIESAAAQIEDKDFLVRVRFQPVNQRRGGGFVDDAHHFQPGDFARVFGGLPLAVAEISRHGDDRLCHRRAQVGFGVRFEFAQNHGRDFLRGVGLSGLQYLHARVFFGAGHHFIGHHAGLCGHLVRAASHETLYGINRVLGIGHRLSLRGLANQPFSILVKRHDGGQSAVALAGVDDGRVAAFHYRHYRIGRPKVNSDYF